MTLYTFALDTMNIIENKLRLMKWVSSQLLLLRTYLGLPAYIELLGVVCVLIVRMFIPTRKKKIKHSSHEHPLMLLKRKFIHDSDICKGCKVAFSGKSMVYGCERCNYYLHKFCAELKQETVSVDVDCALQSAVTSESDEQIQHFSHLHLLKVIERKEDDDICCNVCDTLSRGLTYGCDRCNYFLHKSCMDNLQQKIQHVFHKCTLILLRASYFHCGCCRKTRSGLAFCCRKCNFFLDVKCALLPTMVSDVEKQIKHVLHGHPLMMWEKEYVGVAYCELCRDLCFGVTYGCSLCDFNLHDSCAHLPQTVQHNFHTCSLTLYNTSTYKCNGCEKVQSGLVFCSRKCSFYLC